MAAVLIGVLGLALVEKMYPNRSRALNTVSIRQAFPYNFFFCARNISERFDSRYSKACVHTFSRLNFEYMTCVSSFIQLSTSPKSTPTLKFLRGNAFFGLHFSPHSSPNAHAVF